MTNKNLSHSAHYSVMACMGESGGSIPEINTTLLINYTTVKMKTTATKFLQTPPVSLERIDGRI